MKAVAVKVCGLTRPEDARAAARAGASAIGLVFWPGSPRAVTLDAARRVADAVPPFVQRVGVFVDASAEEIVRAVDAVGLDLVQLHGHEPAALADALPRRALKAIGVGEAGAPLAELEAWLPRAAGILLDTRAPGVPGGGGRVFDWSTVASLRARIPYLVLAGGLDASNVSTAIAALGPDAVDVSSGVESAPGRKDEAKMLAFVEAARSACR